MATANGGKGAKKGSAVDIKSRGVLFKKVLTAISSNNLDLRDKNIYPARISVLQPGTEKRHNNALMAFAPDCTLEEQVLLVDDTLLGSGKKGFLFTVDGLYTSRGYFEEVPMPVLYEELAGVEIAKGSRYLILHYRDGSDVKVYSGHYTRYLCAALQAVLQALEEEAAEEGQLATEDLYAKGMAFFAAGDYERAYKMLRIVERNGDVEKYPKAMVALGWLYEKGQGTDADPFGALSSYANAAQSGDREGMAGVVRVAAANDDERFYWLALKYAKQLNTEEAQKLLPLLEQKMAASPGDAANGESEPAASLAQGANNSDKYAKGLALFRAKDYDAAFPLLQAALVGNNDFSEDCLEAMTAISWLYENGCGTMFMRDEALRGYEKAAEHGHIGAQCRLGELYSSGGLGVKQDFVKSAYWYERAAEQGDVEAQYKCGFVYNMDYRGTLNNKAKALYWYERAAEQGHAEAQINCSFMYSSGSDVPQDLAKAFYWAEKSAEQGHAAGQVQLGEMYIAGKGVQRDFAKGRDWLERGAEQGDLLGQINLAKFYLDAGNPLADTALALYWYEKAAEQGNKNVQCLCGDMYFDGKVTEKDYAKALYWYEKAAKQGVAKAQARCDEIHLLKSFEQ